MKKLLLLIAFLPSLAFARGYQHQHKVPTPPVATSTPPMASSSFQFGFFMPPTGVPSAITEEFTDGSFVSSWPTNLMIFYEPTYTDAQVLAGQMDSQLTAFAEAAAKHQGEILMPLNEEVNCYQGVWGGAYPGNTPGIVIQTYEHEYAIIKKYAPNVEVGYSVNNGSCYGEAGLMAYAPPSQYMDFIGLDGFDFGGQTWAQVFDSAIDQLEVLNKPIWIASEGAVPQDNQSQFIEDSFAGAAMYNLQGIIYFNYSPTVLGSSGVTTVKNLL